LATPYLQTREPKAIKRNATSRTTQEKWQCEAKEQPVLSVKIAHFEFSQMIGGTVSDIVQKSLIYLDVVCRRPGQPRRTLPPFRDNNYGFFSIVHVNGCSRSHEVKLRPLQSLTDQRVRICTNRKRFGISRMPASYDTCALGDLIHGLRRGQRAEYNTRY
jgi:hypothetical protein